MVKKYSFSQTDTTLHEDNVCYFRESPYAFVKFPKYSDSLELLSLQKDDCVLSVTIKKPKNSKKHFTPQFIRLKDMQSDKTVLKDYIIFEDVSNGMDICYNTTGRIVDETIEIKTAAKKYTVSYLIYFSNMYWEYCKAENKILFFNFNTHAEVFCIPFSFMTDAKGVLSIGVKYKLKLISDTCIQLQIEANKSWIEQHKDNMPITIQRQILIRT